MLNWEEEIIQRPHDIYDPVCVYRRNFSNNCVHVSRLPRCTSRLNESLHILVRYGLGGIWSLGLWLNLTFREAQIQTNETSNRAHRESVPSHLPLNRITDLASETTNGIRTNSFETFFNYSDRNLVRLFYCLYSHNGSTVRTQHCLTNLLTASVGVTWHNTSYPLLDMLKRINNNW